LARAQHDVLIVCAVALYWADQARVLGPKERRKGGAKICTELEQGYYWKYKKNIKLSPSTLDLLVKGGTPKSILNTTKGWLLPEEEEVVIKYAIEVASCGFPLMH
ncbi:hypothetical protein K438DRAFT_2092251, partial [Mycena galopus ATCC 62051]